MSLSFSSSDAEDEPTKELKSESKSAFVVAYEKSVRPYIDLVDELRQHGLDRDISLPSVIVIGDQSSGKSSILEAISCIKLPRGSGIVTRCPLEMQLKKARGVDDSWAACLSYNTASGRHQMEIKDPESVDVKIREAQNEIAGGQKNISKELITLQVKGKNCPDLTVIDLPGIARTAVEGQDKGICEQIKRLLKSYAEKKNTIILCVIPSNVDIATNEALSLAMEYDPKGIRTLGVLTKPDLVDPGTEHDIMAILKNEKFYLVNGYSIVRCRGQMDIDKGMSLEDALEQEENYFAEHRIFTDIPEEQRGTQKLAMKLTDQLVEHIKRTLPMLRDDVRHKLDANSKKLQQMGQGPPSAAGEKRLYLMKLINTIMKELEAYIVKGEQIPTEILLDKSLDDPDKCNTSIRWRQRFDEYRDKIEVLTERCFSSGDMTVNRLQRKLNFYRGRELPRFINFDLFETLVKEHTSQYKDLSLECLESMSNDLKAINQYVCDNILHHVPSIRGHIGGICEECRIECMAKGQELIQLEMEKEQLVYTQDRTYLIELKRLEDKQSEDSAENGRRVRKSQSMSFKLTAADAEEEFENNAEVMQHLLKVYLDVANRRMQDGIPMLLRTTQHIHYLRALEDRLQNLAAGEKVEELVTEDPRVGSERRQLAEKCQRLSLAMKKLNYTPS